jgi:hypothetical protein
VWTYSVLYLRRRYLHFIEFWPKVTSSVEARSYRYVSCRIQIKASYIVRSLSIFTHFMDCNCSFLHLRLNESWGDVFSSDGETRNCLSFIILLAMTELSDDGLSESEIVELYCDRVFKNRDIKVDSESYSQCDWWSPGMSSICRCLLTSILLRHRTALAGRQYCRCDRTREVWCSR